MRKNKAGYICLTLAIAALLIIFGKTFLLWILVGLIVLVIITTILIKRDVNKIKVEVRVQEGSQEGKDYTLGIFVEGIKKLTVCGYLLLELEIENQMLQDCEFRKYLIPLSDTEMEYDISMHAKFCGEMRFFCSNLWAVDYFHLFHVPVRSFEEARMLVYPRNIDLQVELSKEAIGATREDINLQSRAGNDPSEMYDVREYIPGDDIRSVHWKLSSKMDQLLLRQSSDPTHYHVVLLPDFGRIKSYREDQEMQENKELINGAAAICAETGRQLIYKRESFCMALPMDQGLKVLEIQNERQLMKAIAT